jgi:hypothetical protein
MRKRSEKEMGTTDMIKEKKKRRGEKKSEKGGRTAEAALFLSSNYDSSNDLEKTCNSSVAAGISNTEKKKSDNAQTMDKANFTATAAPSPSTSASLLQQRLNHRPYFGGGAVAL